MRFHILATRGKGGKKKDFNPFCLLIPDQKSEFFFSKNTPHHPSLNICIRRKSATGPLTTGKHLYLGKASAFSCCVDISFSNERLRQTQRENTWRYHIFSPVSPYALCYHTAESLALPTSPSQRSSKQSLSQVTQG